MAISHTAQSSNAGRPEWAKARRIVVKIGSSLLVDRASGELKSAWLASLADDVAALVGAGKQVILVSSGAIALGRHVLGFAQGRAGAREVAGGRGRRADLARRRLPGRVQGARADRRADPADARRHRGAPPLPQRPPDHRHAAGRARRARRQRERHGGDRRDPLRRQRPPVGARRQHDERRLPGAAVRHRRPLHRAARQRHPDARLIPEVRQITPEIEAMAGGAGYRAVARRHGHQDRGRQDRAGLRHQHGDHLGHGGAPLARGWTRARPAPGSWRRPIRSPRASAGSPASSSPRGSSRSTPGRRRRCSRARACCRPAWSAVGGRLRARRRGGDPLRRRARARPRPGRLRAEDAARIIGKKSGEIAAILGYEGRAALVHRDDMVLEPGVSGA